ncbi:conjugal transfer pilus assembly protein TraH [Escherichia coli]|nr:conjugal transfer pilus assembly protein TraH [Escherichia coli]
MNEVYVIAGGEWLRNNLNAIAAFMGTRTWDSIEKIALTLSVLAVAVMWVQRHNVMDLLGWVAVFVLISLLVNVRTSVQIIDNSDLVKVRVNQVFEDGDGGTGNKAFFLVIQRRVTDRSIIRAMMEGGTAKIYHCNDSDKCLKVVADTPVTISRDNALKSQITKLLASIQNKAVSDTPLDDKEKGFISSTTIPVFKYLVDPQMLGVSNSMIYQLTDYIGYDILLQYIQELIQQARAMVATGNYDEAVIEHINDNMNDATRQIAAFQSQVQVQQDALLVVDRQMSYMRQQLSARMLSRYQNNYHFGGSTL